MPRRGTVTRQETPPRPGLRQQAGHARSSTRYFSTARSSIAETIVYGALEIVRAKTGRDPVDVLQESIQALTPHLEVRSRRVGGATYQVPVEVPGRRARTLAIRWLVSFARERREKVMAERLAAEILDSLAGQGGAFKKKDDIFRMAQANKAFAHYRW